MQTVLLLQTSCQTLMHSSGLCFYCEMRILNHILSFTPFYRSSLSIPPKSCQIMILLSVFHLTVCTKKFSIGIIQQREKKRWLLKRQATQSTYCAVSPNRGTDGNRFVDSLLKIWHPLQSDHSAQSTDWGLHLFPGCTPSNTEMKWGTPLEVSLGL